MKILHITDSHGTAKGPESRKDIYYITFLKKLYELGFIVKKMNVDMIIHTGDLFHTARVSDKFAGQVSELIKAMGVPFYVVPGNHDIEGYTTDTIDQTKLGLLAKAGVVTILDRDNPVSIIAHQDEEEYTVAISGQEYYAHIDEGNPKDYEMQQDEADLNILAIHGYIADKPQHPDIKCTLCQNVITDADIILTGHYHRSFEWSDGQSLDIFNPGSMMRVEQTDYNKNHIPQYGILDIGLDKSGNISWDYNFHKFKIAQPSTTVFDYQSKYQAKAHSITLNGFKTSISNTMNAIQPSMTIDKIITDICKSSNVDASIENSTLKAYHDTLQTIPDEFEAQQGYVESQHTKKISKVILNNFQSHSHTEIELDEGLNIIVGESNNGKTSILRGIMWVIDNQPLGTDFIMAGQNDCSVRIEYSDGTFIERGRTLKDTGYYKIRYIDENGNLQDEEYRGFTNAVPVEVANVHQMPKVNITKDIETHLNVLSQLDAPFLLTESPLVKASAIGRITGTHVVDAAIKDSNKTIQGNNKTIKTYESELKEKENALNALPDVQLMSDFTNAYAAILSHINRLSDDIDNIGNSYANIQNHEKAIVKEEKTYNECCIMQSLKPIVDNAIAKQQEVIKLEKSLFSYNSNNQNIQQQEKELNNTKPLRLMKPLIDKAWETKLYIDHLNAQLVSCNRGIEQEEQAEQKKELYYNYKTNLNSLIAHCQLLYDYNSRLIPKVNSITELENKQDKAAQDVLTTKTFVKNTEKEIKKVQKEKNSFILDNEICPCCGQRIDKSHVSTITNFMEGNNG
jgi:exonuclease SbcC